MLAAPPIASNERERPRGAVLYDIAGFVGLFGADSGPCDGCKSKARDNVRTKLYISACIIQWQYRDLEYNTNGNIAYLAGSKNLRERIPCNALTYAKLETVKQIST